MACSRITYQHGASGTEFFNWYICWPKISRQASEHVIRGNITPRNCRRLIHLSYLEAGIKAKAARKAWWRIGGSEGPQVKSHNDTFVGGVVEWSVRFLYGEY